MKPGMPQELFPTHTSIAYKIAVALSGLGLAGFVLFHMLGNLQVFEGPEVLNAYAAFLRNMPILLWSVRLGLAGIFVLHIGLAVKLAVQNRQARPVGYAVRRYRAASLASRTMALSGALLLAFIVFHLLHMTAGVVDPSITGHVDAQGHRDVFGKVVRTFQNPLFVAIYLAGQIFLGLHLSHALSSSFRTLGLEHPILDRLFKGTGPVLALFIVLGNVAIILAVAMGIVHA